MGCVYVCTYVHTYLLVTLRNVNLQSCLGTQASLNMRYMRMSMENRVGGWGRSMFLRMGRTARLGLCTVRIWLSQAHKRVLSTTDGWQLSEKNKAKKSVHHRSQDSKNRSKRKSLYNQFLTPALSANPHAQCT